MVRAQVTKAALTATATAASVQKAETDARFALRHARGVDLLLARHSDGGMHRKARLEFRPKVRAADWKHATVGARAARPDRCRMHRTALDDHDIGTQLLLEQQDERDVRSTQRATAAKVAVHDINPGTQGNGLLRVAKDIEKMRLHVWTFDQLRSAALDAIR